MDFFEHGGRHGGTNITYDFSANINPLGMPDAAVQVLQQEWKRSEGYPEETSHTLRRAIALQWQAEEEQLVCTNGASELIYAAVRALRPVAGLIMAPTFSEYERALLAADCPVKCFPLLRENGFQAGEGLLTFLEQQPSGSLLFLCNPNNPVGNCMDPQLSERVLRLTARKKIWLAADETFLPFCRDYENISMKRFYRDYGNLLIINAFTKLYAMPGLRLGYGICADREVIRNIRRQLPAWNVSVPAQLAGLAALREQGYQERTIEYLEKERAHLIEGLQKREKLIYRIYPSRANFIFLEAVPGLDRMLAEKGFAIRSCENYRRLGPGDFRIAVRTREENEALLKALDELEKESCCRERQETVWQKI